MSLSSGTRFGPYEALSQIGAVGMGAVYRARDTRPRREVVAARSPAVTRRESSGDSVGEPGGLQRRCAQHAFRQPIHLPGYLNAME